MEEFDKDKETKEKTEVEESKIEEENVGALRWGIP